VFVSISPGNHHEGTKVIPMLEGMRAGGMRKPRRLHADTNYDTPLLRYYLRRKHVVANIPSRVKRRRRGRPRLFDREALRKIRYTVERFFSWIKSFRRIDSRYDRRADSFMGFIRIACSLILMKEVSR
jgi:transposase